MTTALAVRPEAGALFVDPTAWADMDAWYEHVAELRKQSPVLRVEADGFAPFYALTRHPDVMAVSRDNENWLNTPWSVLGLESDKQRAIESQVFIPRSLVQLDGAEHREHRKVTSDWFKPAAVAGRQERIDEIADIFVERMRDLGDECDFACDVAQPFTLRVIMDMYGVPMTDEHLMLELTQGVFGAADPEFLGDAGSPEERVFGSLMRFILYFNQITDDRKARPRDDLATVIANGTIGSCPLGDAERLWYYIIIATAGHDTTSYALSGGMHALLRNPDQLHHLKQDPSLMGNAAEEILRWATPVRHFLRYAARDSDVHDVAVREGERVLLSYPAANRDPGVFEDPDRFDVQRPNADRHLAFGMGGHFCLGSRFARREIRTLLSKLLPKLESIELAGPVRWSQSHFVSGVKHLPVRYRFGNT
jgi:cytochrome P450